MGVILDGMSIHNREELHELLAQALGFPAWYGGNMDALFDCLTELREDTEIVLCHTEALEENLGPYAGRIARAVMKHFRQGGAIETTRQLAAVVERALSFLPPAERKEAVKKSCQRTFQALRIDVNSEFEVLYAFLEKLPGVLKCGGRVAVLTFHSGEDRLVKKAFKQGLRNGVYQEIAGDVIRPSAEECFQNPRARSTKLRWAIRA